MAPSSCKMNSFRFYLPHSHIVLKLSSEIVIELTPFKHFLLLRRPQICLTVYRRTVSPSSMTGQR